MKKLLEEAGHVPSLIPSWKPDERTSEDLAKHISKLCIPIDSAGNPNMLLHDLGEERNDEDAQRTARIPNIPSSYHHTCVNVTFILTCSISITYSFPGYLLIPQVLAKLGYSSRACVVDGDFILWRNRIPLALGQSTFGKLFISSIGHA